MRWQKSAGAAFGKRPARLCKSVRLFALFFILSPLAASSSVAPQKDLRFDHISIEQGLSDLTVYCFAQDSTGFLWFGTADGLNRYDGYSFTVFRSDPADTTSMAPGPINSLCVDRSGVLWIGTPGGLSSFLPDSSKPRRVSSLLAFGVSTAPYVTWLQTLRNGDVAIGTSAGLFIREWSSGKFARLPFGAFEPVEPVTFTESHDGTLWIGAGRKGLLAFDRVNGTCRRYGSDQRNPDSLSGDAISRIAEDRAGAIWVATSYGVCRLDRRTQSFVRYLENKGLAADIVFDLLPDRKGNLWVGTFHIGAALYRPATDDFVRYTNDPEDPQSLTSDRVTRMFEDNGGVLWFAIYRAGLNRLNQKRSAFTQFVPRRTSGLGLSGEFVYGVVEDKAGDVWVGTYGGGLNRYNPATRRYMYYRHQQGRPHTISSDGIVSIVESRTGDLWVGSAGLDKVDRSTSRFIHYPMVNEHRRTGSDLEVKSILEGSDGYVWFGTFTGGLHKLDPRTGKTSIYPYPGVDSSSHVSPGIWALCEDSRGRLWMGSYGAGLLMMDKRTGSFRRFLHDDAHPLTTLSNNGIYALLKDDQDRLWIGTMGGGLDLFDLEKETFRHYTVNDGLPNNFVKGIEKDTHGNLWLSTDFGLSRLDPKTGTFENIKAEDGLMGNVFLSGAHFISRSGRLYFGGEKGAVAFHPDSIRKNAFVPPVVITSLLVVNNTYPLSMPRTFSHDMNSVAFEFVALDFTLPDKNQYAYMMEGVDQSWVYTGTRRYARYAHLDPGTYTFKVRGSNNDGIWNEKGASLTFTITPPYWDTWWFRIGAALLAIGLVVYAYNFRVNRLLEIERLRVKIASDLHDDIGSSLTRISLQSELIQEGIEPTEVNSYLKNIAGTSRELVSTMSDIVWSIDARNDMVENLLMKIRDFAANTFAPKGIEMRFAHSGLDVRKRLSVEKRENIYLICKEAVNNIAKHSDASHVSIVIRNDHDKFTVVIEDDGRGLGAGERLNGHGVKNMRMRAARLGGSVEFLSDNGTRVVLTTKPL